MLIYYLFGLDAMLIAGVPFTFALCYMIKRYSNYEMDKLNFEHQINLFDQHMVVVVSRAFAQMIKQRASQ